jgi:hypothetical protein
MVSSARVGAGLLRFGTLQIQMFRDGELERNGWGFK